MLYVGGSFSEFFVHKMDLLFYYIKKNIVSLKQRSIWKQTNQVKYFYFMTRPFFYGFFIFFKPRAVKFGRIFITVSRLRDFTILFLFQLTKGSFGIVFRLTLT